MFPDLPLPLRRLFRPGPLAASGALAGALLLLAACGGDADRRPNVLLISLDTCRPDHLSGYGYPRQTSPHLDALAEDGHRLTRAVAVSNWTLPTHATMLCGLYPRAHGAHRLTQEPGSEGRERLGRMAEACLTLPEILAGEGFRTGAIVANTSYLQPKTGLDQGFDTYDYLQPGPPLFYRRAEEITDRAIEWIERRSDAPFFLFLNYMDPHFPYLPPPGHDMRYSENMALRRRYRDWESFRERISRFGPEPLTAEEAAFFRDQYDAEIGYMDEQIGRLLDRLRRLGLYDETLVLVTSDHGEAFGEHGVVGHGATLYQHQTAIVLIVKTPGAQPTAPADLPASQVDILPTVLDLLGLEIPAAAAGASLFENRPRDLFAEVHPRSAADTGHRLAVFRGPLTYLLSSDGRWELYDLASDPGELSDLRGRSEALGAYFGASLRRWLAETRPLSGAEAAAPFDDAELEALRALGYVD